MAKPEKWERHNMPGMVMTFAATGLTLRNRIRETANFIIESRIIRHCIRYYNCIERHKGKKVICWIKHILFCVESRLKSIGYIFMF